MNLVQLVHAGSRPVKHPATNVQSGLLLFNLKLLLWCVLPEEQHDGKRLAGPWRQRHTDLDGLLQVLLGNVEAVVVDPVVEEDVLVCRTLKLVTVFTQTSEQNVYLI